MKQGRVRTESMVQRFAKTAIGEGFDLWDRDYLLGAMRLFLFKSESAPPFQVGPCLDATGEILAQMEEYEDASEQFTLAAEKYALIQQPVLAELMRTKVTECVRGPRAALAQLEPFLEAQETAKPRERPTRSAVARARAYHASLLLQLAAEEAEAEAEAFLRRAVAAARSACLEGWDRAHTGHLVLGDALLAMGQAEAACREYAKAAELNPNSLAAIERQLRGMKGGPDGTEAARRRLLDAAIALHPRPTLLREKAFLLSETEGDAAALAFLDPLIRNPPPEEADAMRGVGGETVATLLKARAAILADAGNMQDALQAAQAALKESPEDEEAAAIVAEIQQEV